MGGASRVHHVTYGVRVVGLGHVGGTVTFRQLTVACLLANPAELPLPGPHVAQDVLPNGNFILIAWERKYSSEWNPKLLKDKSLLIKEVVEFIRIHHQKMKIFVASGADQKDLRELCNYFDIGQYFQSIRGSPTPKTEIVLDLIKRFSLNPLQTALVGDSINDYEAAFKNNIPFFGYNNTKLKSLKESTYLYSIKDINV